jgi:hypothetical protein
MSEAMASYHVERVDDADADSYWVEAESPKEARRLVARNVYEAASAENADIFGCEPSTEKRPPPGYIYQRLNGPLAMKKL